VLGKLAEDAEFSGSLGGVGFVVLGLFSAPGSLTGEGLLEVFELDLVVFEGVLELGEEVIGGGDEGTESSLLVGQGLLLGLEGGEEDFPVSLGLILVLVGDLLLLDDSGADILEEI